MSNPLQCAFQWRPTALGRAVTSLDRKIPQRCPLMGSCRITVGEEPCKAQKSRPIGSVIWESRRFHNVHNVKAARLHQRGIVSCNSQSSPKVQRLRELLSKDGIIQGPACQDALSARLIEQARFDMAFMSGFSVSAARLALPDTGLTSYGELVEEAGWIAGAVSIPVIGDADTGFGNAINVKRTVRGYAAAGMAGILIEDQVMPKACGHTRGRRVVPREEAVTRIRAAVDARNEGSDIVIVARTDARQAESLSEALWRVQAFADAGADVVFIDALASKEEMASFCRAVKGVPKMANMLEGGGRTPILTPLELEQIGFKLVAYPLSLLGVSIRAMQDALAALKSGRMPPPAALPSFDEIKEVVGFPEYYREEERYATPSASSPAAAASSKDKIRPEERASPAGQRSGPGSDPLLSGLEAEVARLAARAEASGSAARVAGQMAAEDALARARASGSAESPGLFWGGTTSMPGTVIRDGGKVGGKDRGDVRDSAAEGQVWQAGGMAGEGGRELPDSEGDGAVKSRSTGLPVVEADKVLNEEQASSRSKEKAEPGWGPLPNFFGGMLRVIITGRNGETELETRIPAAFLKGFLTTIPVVAGLDLEELMKSVSRRGATGSGPEPIIDFESGKDRIRVYLEL